MEWGGLAIAAREVFEVKIRAVSVKDEGSGFLGGFGKGTRKRLGPEGIDNLA